MGKKWTDVKLIVVLKISELTFLFEALMCLIDGEKFLKILKVNFVLFKSENERHYVI